MSSGAGLAAAAASTVFLVALHLAAPRLRRLPRVPERIAGSFAAGVAAAYVFLHMLPELAAGHGKVHELFGGETERTPLWDLGVFVVALAAFVGAQGIDRLATRGGEDNGPLTVYRVHAGSFAAYNAFITYTLPVKFRTGAAFAILFTVAMGLHFLLVDRNLARRWPRRFSRRGRVLLASALVAGWLLAALVPPALPGLVTVLLAALGGAILATVLTDEITGGDDASYGWFVAGLGAYAVLLVAVTAMEG